VSPTACYVNLPRRNGKPRSRLGRACPLESVYISGIYARLHKWPTPLILTMRKHLPSSGRPWLAIGFCRPRVSSLPDPAANSSPAYLWLYRFLHTIAGNITTALREAARYCACASPGSKIPGVNAAINGAATTILLLFLVSCTAHYSIHPGALNKTDSAAYDTLLIAETTIDQARLDYQAGQLPAGAEPALDALIRSDNVARASWLAYRGAFATNVPSPQYFDQLTKNLTDLSAAIRFEEAMK
jgi:hypothetical protein